MHKHAFELCNMIQGEKRKFRFITVYKCRQIKYTSLSDIRIKIKNYTKAQSEDFNLKLHSYLASIPASK